MEAMDRVTFVQGVFCGVLLTVLGFAAFGPSHHPTNPHATETAGPQPAVEERHPEVISLHAPASTQPTPIALPHATTQAHGPATTAPTIH